MLNFKVAIWAKYPFEVMKYICRKQWVLAFWVLFFKFRDHFENVMKLWII